MASLWNAARFLAKCGKSRYQAEAGPNWEKIRPNSPQFAPNHAKIRAKKLQPPEAVWHSEGCCSPQNDYKISWRPNRCNLFLKKSLRLFYCPAPEAFVSAGGRGSSLKRLAIFVHCASISCKRSMFAAAKSRVSALSAFK